VKEFVFAALLISPLVKYALIAALVFIPIRSVWFSLSLGFKNAFWHPLLMRDAISWSSSRKFIDSARTDML
jgi:hypothetical protein